MNDRQLDPQDMVMMTLTATVCVMVLVLTACVAADTYLKFKNNGSRTTTAIELNMKKQP